MKFRAFGPNGIDSSHSSTSPKAELIVKDVRTVPLFQGVAKIKINCLPANLKITMKIKKPAI
jgi:hypothetical protein